LNWFDTVGQWMKQPLHLSIESQYKLLESLIVIVFAIIVRWLVMKLVQGRTEDIRIRYHWKKVSTYVMVFMLLLVLGKIWLKGFESLSTYLGLVSAGLAIALKDPIVNMVGWGFLLWKRPFQVGDRIQIGDLSGDVIDLRLFQFSLMEIGNWVASDQSTGRIVHVNNGLIFTKSLANYGRSFDYIWDEIPVVVTFESDWEKAKEILSRVVWSETEHRTSAAEKQVKRAAEKFMIYYKNLTPIVYTSVDDIGVRLTMRYLTEPRKRRVTREAIWEAVLRAFAARDDIDFAYPTMRYYNNRTEGKKGTIPLPDDFAEAEPDQDQDQDQDQDK